MRKLKLSILLPAILFPFSCLLFLLYQKFPGQPRLYVPVDFFLTCLNAPAWILGDPLAALLKELTPRNVYISFGGIEPKKLLSLLLVLPTWWWLGRTIERRDQTGGIPEEQSLKSLFANVALVNLGGLLMMLTIVHLVHLVQPFAAGDPYMHYLRVFSFFSLAALSLMLAWALFLIIFPARKVVRAIRAGVFRQLPFFRQ